MRGGCMDWYLYGDWDTERYIAKLRDYCPILAGATFGAAWWVLIDAILYTKSVLGGSFPWTYLIPGFAATLALIFMNLVSREELLELNDDTTEEEGAALRARCWLFFSYIVAFGAIAGAVAVLIQSRDGDGGRQHVGVASLIETAFIVCSGLLLWSFRTQSDEYMPF